MVARVASGSRTRVRPAPGGLVVRIVASYQQPIVLVNSVVQFLPAPARFVC
jgi:hypothetical protein